MKFTIFGYVFQLMKTPPLRTISDDNIRRFLPRYQSTKIIGAAKIESITGPITNPIIDVYPNEVVYGIKLEGIAWPVTVRAAYVEKHLPKVGGYFVQYPDGYESWSPADVFEAGNVLIGVKHG